MLLRARAHLMTIAIAAAATLVGVSTASAQTATGGAAYVEPAPVAAPAPAAAPAVPGASATLNPDGTATVPAGAPQEVVDAIAAANRIIGKPYVYGGGHTLDFSGRGYDCSGTVSYALQGFLKAPLDSSSFLKWEDAGAGTWITVYTNPGHAFAVIAGLRLDTSAAGDPSGAKGPRWRPALRSTKGFKARHPAGL